MKYFTIFFLMISSFLVFNTAVYSENLAGQTLEVQDAVQLTAKVIKIDQEKRKVTLEGKDGKTKTIKLPKAIKGIDQIKKGDILDIEIIYALAIKLAKPGEMEGESISAEVRYNKEGEKPMQIAVETVEVVAKIKSLDLATRTVTLVGKHGHTIDLIADASVKNFNTLKVGEEVHAKYTEAFAIGFVHKKE